MVTSKNTNVTGEKFVEKHRWELAEYYLKRSESSANILRALLFALSVGSVGFIIKENWKTFDLDLQALSVLLFSNSIGIIVFSWKIQKHKSIKRFKILRDKPIEKYYELERKYEKKMRNFIIDRWAAGTILFAFLAEFAALYSG